MSKLYPGLLVLYLLLRRDWRAVAWIALFSIAIRRHLDRGLRHRSVFRVRHAHAEAPERRGVPALRNPVAIAVNESIPGLVFKLHLFGVPQMGFAASRVVGWVYTVIAVVLTPRLALQPVAAGREPLAWIAILILATMRSPFLPTYAPFPSMWAATLLTALTWGRSGICITAAAAWVVLAFTFGTGGAPPAVNAIWTFTHTIAAFVLVALVFRVTPASREHHAVASPLALASARLTD